MTIKKWFTSIPVCAALCVCLMGASSFAQTETVLFTTQEDFAGFAGGTDDGSFPVGASATDLDGSSVNGLFSGGGAGTPGSLEISDPDNLSDFFFIFSPGLQGTATEQALTDYDAIVFDHSSLPAGLDFSPTSDGSFFQLGITLNSNLGFDILFGDTVDNGDGTSTTTIPIDFNPDGALVEFLQLGITVNSDAGGAFNVDNIRTVSAVPEPSTVMLLGLAAPFVLRSRRR